MIPKNCSTVHKLNLVHHFVVVVVAGDSKPSYVSVGGGVVVAQLDGKVKQSDSELIIQWKSFTCSVIAKFQK